MTTDTDQQTEDDDLMPDFYVEKNSGMIFECKFFDTFVLVRPATPRLYLAIRKLSHKDFISNFEEFGGDKNEVRDFIRGAEPNFIIN